MILLSSQEPVVSRRSFLSSGLHYQRQRRRGGAYWLLTTGYRLLFFSLIKRHGDYLRADHSTANVNLYRLTDGCVIKRHVGHADVLLQVRRGAARSDVTDALTIDVNVLAVARNAALRDLEADELAAHAFFFLPGERVAPRKVALAELGNPAEVGFQKRRLFGDLVAVERHACFEAERVARCQTCGQDAFGRAVAARVENLVPETFGLLRRGVDLEAVLARVARARDDGGHVVNAPFAEVVILDLRERRRGESLHDAQGFRALECELAEVGAAVRERDALVTLVGDDPVPVFVGRRGVDDEQEVFGAEAIDEQVVNDRAFGRRERGILRLSVNELRRIVRAEAVHERDRVGADDFDLAHMRHVEEARARARAIVLFDRARGVLHGHVPAAELDHAPAQTPVRGVQRILLECGRARHGSPCSF